MGITPLEGKAKLVVENLKYHAIDSTALLASTHPIFSTFETMVAGMSDEVSLASRLYITGLTYLGLGWAIGRGRDLSHKLLKITDETKEKLQQIHDSAYLAAINLPLGIGLYMKAGETDIERIAIGTAVGMAIGAFGGPLIGYAIDLYRDLTGLKNCKRKFYPNFLRNLKSKTKKGIAIGLTIASVGAMGAIYSLTPDKFHYSQNEQSVHKESVIVEDKEQGLENLVAHNF